MNFLLLVVGLAVLSLGAEILVGCASRIAVAIGISPLVVGLTIVAFGTSAPELVVSLHSALKGNSDVALGNVLGSNIFNVLFILGISAMIIPLRVSIQLIRIEVPLMITVSLLVGLMALDGRIGRWEGAMLFTGLLVYTVIAIVGSRRQQAAVTEEALTAEGIRLESRFPWMSPGLRIAMNLLGLFIGLSLLVLGARVFIDAAVQIAMQMGVSEMVIGLTLVAAGTSLPEVATSILAAIRGQRDIAVGNVVGSNLFNLMGVLGVSSLLAPNGIPVSNNALWMDFPVMIAVAVACMPIFLTGALIARWEGGLFFGYYLLYTIHLLLTETDSELTRGFEAIMLFGVLPLTAVTLAVGMTRAVRASRRPLQRNQDPPVKQSGQHAS
jgi:cation:H+ antiporter